MSFCNIYGTQANAFAAIDADELFVQGVGQAREPVELEPVDTLKAELEEFADACAGTRSFRVDPEEAVHTVAVMQAIATSAAKGGDPVILTRGDA